MSRGRQKSAKDRAFDKERYKYHAKIRELESELSASKLKVCQLEEEKIELINSLESSQNLVNRLLEYTKLSESEMRSIIEKDKLSARLIGQLADIDKLFGSFIKFV